VSTILSIASERISDASATCCASGEAALAEATPSGDNAFKIELGKRVVKHALHQAATMEI